MEEALATTNLLLGILAAASVVQVLALLWLAFEGYRASARLTRTVEQLEGRLVAPISARVGAILDDVEGVTSRVQQRAQRIETAVDRTVGRVGSTARDAQQGMARSAREIVSVVVGLRDAIAAMLTTRAQPTALATDVPSYARPGLAQSSFGEHTPSAGQPAWTGGRHDV